MVISNRPIFCALSTWPAICQDIFVLYIGNHGYVKEPLKLKNVTDSMSVAGGDVTHPNRHYKRAIENSRAHLTVLMSWNLTLNICLLV